MVQLCRYFYFFENAKNLGWSDDAKSGAPKENIVQNHFNITLLNVFYYLDSRYRHTFIPYK